MFDHDTPTRSIGAIVVKVLTVHIMVAWNYTSLSKVQRRKLPGWVNVFHIVFFVFTPTFLVVESIASVASAIINLARDRVDGRRTELSFTLSAALGSCATSQHRDEDPSATRHVPLIEFSCSQCNRTTSRVGWTWVGKIIICIFTLAQGVGTIINWVQRIVLTTSPLFGFDDRVGGMGVAITIMSSQTLLLLLMRTNYTVDRPSTLLQDNSIAQYGRRFIVLALLATGAQEFTRVRNYRSAGLVQQSVFMKNWVAGVLILSTIFVVAVLYQNTNFENAVVSKMYRKWVSRTIRWRIRNCTYVGILASIFFVLTLKVAQDVIDLTGWTVQEQWVQTPLSEIIPIL